jgi:hypothetical protein
VVVAGSPRAAQAQALAQRMAGDEARALRLQGGFE